MDLTVPGAASSELAPAFLLLAVTLGLSWVFWSLHRRHRKAYFAWWGVAWLLYALRLAAIVAFLGTEQPAWLYWHQVATGWTALVLLWAALVFSQRRVARAWYGLLLLFPPLWSWVAIYRMEDFLSAAVPSVVFLSGATILTAWAFGRHDRLVGSPSARFLAVAFLLWGLHHLDYPFLRARGVWNPWGYYLDAVLALAVGAGILLLVQEDLLRGLGALAGISSELQGRGGLGDPARSLLLPALSLPGVRGTALLLFDEDGSLLCVAGAGVCGTWQEDGAPASLDAAVGGVRSGQDPVVVRVPRGQGEGTDLAFSVVLPVTYEGAARGAFVVVGDARDPFAALDRSVLDALGNQVGAALERADLYARLGERTAELERLTEQMVRQHEAERRRLSRELHDETAQLFAAVNLQLGAIAEAADPATGRRIADARALVGEGIRGIRNLTDRLRPTLLDDVGLLPALRALMDEFAERSGLQVEGTLPEELPPMSEEAELACFRTLQEGLSNVVRHAEATRVRVAVTIRDASVQVVVADDGRGIRAAQGDAREGPGEPAGLAGLRERLSGLGGTLAVRAAAQGGTELLARIPSEAHPHDGVGGKS